jgi:hypothetical protein
MERHKIRLNTENSQRDVNVEMYQNIYLASESKPLPYNDINKVINENEQFNKERQTSNKYRIVSTINTLFTNVLFNTTGDSSWESFNEPLFRDRSFPPDGISSNQDEDYSYQESVDAHLKERDGWFGYLNPRINAFSDNEFYYMEPSKDKFTMVNRNSPNWGVTVTYPYEKLSNELTENGLTVTSLKQVTVGGREMTAIGSPYNHNLNLRDTVRLITPTTNKTYQVMRLGLDNGDFKENYFVIDTLIGDLDIADMTFKRVSSGVDCEYYFRVFKKVNTVDGTPFSNKDYDLFPLAFSNNVFNDSVSQFSTKDDIDLTGLTDNLGRPVTEIYITFIKSNDNGFTDIKSGLNVKNIYDSYDYIEIPDVRRIHNNGDTPIKSHTPLTDSVELGDDEFIGDLVEYNKMSLRETVLNEVNHRFNTTNREEGGTFNSTERGEEMITRTARGRSNTTSENINYENFTTSEVITRGSGSGSELMFSNGEAEVTENEFNMFTYTRATLHQSARFDEKLCSSPNSASVWMDANTFDLATKLYSQFDGSVKAVSGYYANGNIIRYWNGYSLGAASYCVAETTNPDTGETNTVETTEESVIVGTRQEGYMYKPFYKIQLRTFSDYIEDGDEMTVGIPDYAEKLEDGRYIWRDLMDFGNVNKDLDYPFINGYHYIHKNNIIALRRQDPFGEIGLYYNGDIPDIPGINMTEKHKTRKSGDIC